MQNTLNKNQFKIKPKKQIIIIALYNDVSIK